jgi:hypothetical protein
VVVPAYWSSSKDLSVAAIRRSQALVQRRICTRASSVCAEHSPLQQWPYLRFQKSFLDLADAFEQDAKLREYGSGPRPEV